MNRMTRILLPVLLIVALLCGCSGVSAPALEADSTAVTEAASVSEAPAESAAATDVVPVTWEPSEEHLTIEGEEAQALYQRIKAEDYPSMEELKANPVVQKLDALSAYYKELYGNTSEINTPERVQLREKVLKDFLATGSARTESTDANGKAHYVYDGKLKKDYQMELVLGLPASGKSTRVTDPDSEEMGAFIMDCDVIKEMLPEYQESHGCGADAVHFEGYNLMLESFKEFTQGDKKGTNLIMPLVSSDFDELMDNIIKPFEAAGYNIRVKFCPAKPNEAAARVVMRELAGGQLINSEVAFNFGDGPEKVYNKLAPMVNAKGETYGYDVEAEEDAAA